MEININLGDVESDSARRNQANNTRRTGAAKKTNTNNRKPTTRRTSTAPKAGAARKPAAKKKEVKVPNSVEVLLQRSKPKLRIMHKQPGRYVMKNTQGMWSLFRIKSQVKYTPGMKNKLFAMRDMEAIASTDIEDLEAHAALMAALGAGDYDEPVEELMAEAISYERGFLNAKGVDIPEGEIEQEDDVESDSAAPGARNKAAGAKLGRKKRAVGMLAPGWHMFHNPTGGGKLKKFYVGPRVSARRLMGIVSGDVPVAGKEEKADAKKTAAKKPASKKMSPMEQKKDIERKRIDVKRLPGIIETTKSSLKKFQERFDQTGSKNTEKSLNQVKATLKAQQQRLKEAKATLKKIDGSTPPKQSGRVTANEEGKALMKEAGVGITKLNRMVKDAEKDGDRRTIRVATKLRDAMSAGDVKATKSALRTLDKQFGLDEIEKELGVKGGKLSAMLQKKATKAKPTAKKPTSKQTKAKSLTQAQVMKKRGPNKVALDLMFEFKDNGKLDMSDEDTKYLMDGMKKHGVGLEIVEQVGPGGGAADVRVHGDKAALKKFFKEVMNKDMSDMDVE
jgi:hypothetical protein